MVKTKQNEEMEEQMIVATDIEETPNEAPIEEVAVGEESAEEKPAEAKPVSRSRAFLMAKYPDKTYDNDEDYEEDLANHLEQTEKDLKAYKDADVELEEILDLNPELALVVADMRKGMPFTTALAHNVDLEDIIPIDGEPDYEEFAKSKEERKAKRAADKEREEMLRTNAEKSAKDILAYLEGKGWTEEQKGNFDAWFNDLVQRLSENRLGKDEMDVFVKGYEYDEAVARAEDKGKVAGRNEKIETKRKMQENVDDIPEGGTTSKVATAPKQRQVIDIDRILGRK